MNRPNQNVNMQLQQLVQQYRQEADLAKRLGDTQEGQMHAQRAQQIRSMLEQYQARMRAMTAARNNGTPLPSQYAGGMQSPNMSRAMPQMGMRQMPGGGMGGPGGPGVGGGNGAGPNPGNGPNAGAAGPGSAGPSNPAFENPALMQQHLAQQQFRAEQNQQTALASLQTVQGFKQRQAMIEELRRRQIELDQRSERAEAALRSGSMADDAQRLRQSMQSLRSKREMYRQRELQLVQEMRAAMRAQPQLARNLANMQVPPPGGAPAAGGPGAAAAAAVGAAVGAPGGPTAGVPGGPGGPVPGQLPGQLPGQAPTPLNDGSGLGTPVPGAVGAPGGPTAAGAVALGDARRNVPGRFPQSLPVPSNLAVPQPLPVTVKQGRPTMSNGGASPALAINSPALARIPGFEVSGERVLSKRKLSELVAGVVGETNDAAIDGDVEELLLDLADEFVNSVTSFACKLAKHRHSDTLEAKDIQLHLERNWNLRIPGYASDEVRSVRKIQPAPSYQQKLQGIGMSRQVNR